METIDAVSIHWQHFESLKDSVLGITTVTHNKSHDDLRVSAVREVFYMLLAQRMYVFTLITYFK